jgi:hypothetical protein
MLSRLPCCRKVAVLMMAASVAQSYIAVVVADGLAALL